MTTVLVEVDCANTTLNLVSVAVHVNVTGVATSGIEFTTKVLVFSISSNVVPLGKPSASHSYVIPEVISLY